VAGTVDIGTIQLRLIGEREVQIGLVQTAAATEAVEKSTDRLGRTMGHTARRGFIMNQMLFTLRRVAYATTLGLGALTTAGVAWGLSFNSQMEQATVAFTYFTGSAQLAQKEVDYLFELAAKTPFEFPQLLDATKKFLAFGYTTEQTNTVMQILSDTIAGLGLSGEAIDRAVLAFGQMRAAGRVLGTELRQLTELGIPALQILQEELGLTSEEMAHIGELRIPADVAIPALLRGMQREFKGMAEEQSKTFQGQLSTLRDYTARTLGDITQPLFDRIRLEFLPMAIKVAEAISEGFKAGGFDEAVRRVDLLLDQNGRLVNAWEKAKEVGADLWAVISKGLWPAIRDIGIILKTYVLPWTILFIGGLAWLAENVPQVEWVFKLLLLALIANFVATRLLAIWTYRYAEIALVLLIKRMAQARVVVWLAAFFTNILTDAMIALMIVTGLATWEISLIALAIVGLIALLIFLEYKYQAVSRWVNWVRDSHWSWFLVLLPLIGQIVMLIKFLDMVWPILKRIAHWMGRIADLVPDMPGWMKSAWGATGGRFFGGSEEGEQEGMGRGKTRSPWYQTMGADWMMPTGAINAQSEEMARQMGLQPVQFGGQVQQPVVVQIDGRTIAEAVAQIQLDTQARR
jgi:tape measure domain-containing protein